MVGDPCRAALAAARPGAHDQAPKGDTLPIQAGAPLLRAGAAGFYSVASATEGVHRLR